MWCHPAATLFSNALLCQAVQTNKRMRTMELCCTAHGTALSIPSRQTGTASRLKQKHDSRKWKLLSCLWYKAFKMSNADTVSFRGTSKLQFGTARHGTGTSKHQFLLLLSKLKIGYLSLSIFKLEGTAL